MDEESIFLKALQKSTPADRAVFVEQACGNDVVLRQGVEKLLLAHERAGDFLGASPGIATVDRPVSECPGTIIGPYKLLEQIGEGGFGVVFMAEQQQPVRRKVALKVLKPGMDTRQVIARFEAERQALALMDHQNIARIFDGGETAGGRPYFVMELVKGMPVTEYCDQEQLTPRQRLELFVHVCQAVQHAHQKGIIHRDIKSSNVLVTLHDARPVVKVIDFGIAKAVGQQLTDKTLFTRFTQMIGTPLYMSPEQAALSGLDVDTRSDIYSLGVLLYELLTGTTPFDGQRFREAGFDEIRRIIREEEPPKPSTRISTLGQAALTFSMQRKSDPRRLSQLCRGELDWIVMKCLEKDRERRYETAHDLAGDIERYLRDEPVQARPPTSLYRFRKFARRNRSALTTTVVVATLVLSLFALFTWFWDNRRALHQLESEFGTKSPAAMVEVWVLYKHGKYTEALAAVGRAEGQLDESFSDKAVELIGVWRKELEMILRLQDIRAVHVVGFADGAFDYARADAAYAKAFRDYGIDLETLETAEAVEHLRSKQTLGRELTEALDHWVHTRASLAKATGNPGKTSWKRVDGVAQLADPDEFRNQVRQAFASGDTATLLKLTESPQISNLPPRTLVLLAWAVKPYQEKAHLAMLRRAQQTYPGDHGINFELACALQFQQSPKGQSDANLDDAIRFYTVALAIRPQDVNTHIVLAHALRLRGKLEEEAAVRRWVIGLAPAAAALRKKAGAAK